MGTLQLRVSDKFTPQKRPGTSISKLKNRKMFECSASLKSAIQIRHSRCKQHDDVEHCNKQEIEWKMKDANWFLSWKASVRMRPERSVLILGPQTIIEEFKSSTWPVGISGILFCRICCSFWWVLSLKKSGLNGKISIEIMLYSKGKLGNPQIETNHTTS